MGARGKGPSVNSSFWHRERRAAVIAAAHEKMNGDLGNGGIEEEGGIGPTVICCTFLVEEVE